MEQVGTIWRDNRDIYLIIDADGEAYYFSGGRFYQGLTRFANKGCRIKDIEAKMPALAGIVEDPPDDRLK